MGQPVPTVPARLPGELWGLTAYFNPAGFATKLANLRRFAAGVRAQGLKLAIVELAFGDHPFEVPSDLCDRLERRRTDAVLWQKERLLNIGLRTLPESCDKVAWLDGDIVFENAGWVRKTAELLESYVVVQPFDTACWLLKGATSAPQSFDGHGNKEGQSLPGMACAMASADDKRAALASYYRHGHTGFAWAARRSVLERHGFYDAQILGNGDFVMAHAMYGNEDFWNGRNWECVRLSPQLLAHIAEWGRKFYRDVRGSVTYVPGRVLHQWHGNQSDRQYDERLTMLRDQGFDPVRDLKEDANGCWSWGSDKPALHEWAREYFPSRQED